MESLMKSKFLVQFEELSSLFFTGRINVISEENNQLFATIFIKDGRIVNAQNFNKSGDKALETILIEDTLKNQLKFVSEPVQIDGKQEVMNLSFQEVYEIFQGTINRALACQKLRPPDHLRLAIVPEFIFSGETIESDEFDLLCTISDYAKVGEIYAHAKSSDSETTLALVSLRKKNGLRVFAP